MPPELPAPSSRAELSDATSRLLEFAAVVGEVFSLEDLRLLTGHSPAESWSSLREAVAAGVVADHADGLTFVGDARATSLKRVPAAARRDLDLAFGRALAGQGAHPERIAAHIRLGARHGDRDAVSWIERAALAAADRDPATAVDLFGALAAIDDRPPVERVEVRLAEARSLVESGRLAEAEQLCRTALADVPDSPAEGRLRLCLTDSLMRQGRLGEVHDEAARAAAAGDLKPVDRARVLVWATYGPLHAHDVAALAKAVDVARAAAVEADDVASEAAVEVVDGHRAAFTGELLVAERRHGRAARLVAHEESHEAHLGVPHLGHAMSLAMIDRFDDARAVLAAGRRAYERLGIVPASVIAENYEGGIAFLAGDWLASAAAYRRAAGDDESPGRGWPVDALVSLALLEVRAGRVVEAEQLLARADRHLAAGAIQWEKGWRIWVEGLVAEARGRRDAAAILTEAWAWTRDAPMQHELPPLAPDVLRVLAAGSASDELAEVRRQLDLLTLANPGVRSLGAVAQLASAVQSGDLQELEAAAVAFEGLPPSLAAGLAAEESAVLSAIRGRRAESEAHAVRASAVYAELGAVADQDRVRGRLRAAGVRPTTARARAATAPGWEALTPTEWRVVELVAEGLSNPQIAARLVVSRHTVATHVSHVLAKQGLRSRLELAREVHRHQHRQP